MNSVDDYFQQVADNRLTAIAMLKQMLADLKSAGHSGTIEFTYNGSGDSGDMEGPYHNGKAIPSNIQGSLDALDYKFEYANTTYDANTGKYVSNNNPKHTLLDCINSLLPAGWEINEGSYGDVVLDIDTTAIAVKHNQNITTTEYSEEIY